MNYHLIRKKKRRDTVGSSGSETGKDDNKVGRSQQMVAASKQEAYKTI